MTTEIATDGRQLCIETARAFQPLLDPARYKGVWGGRGSSKSWFFADLLIERFILDPTTRAACIREIQKSLDESVKQLLEDRIKAHGLSDCFQVLRTHIETPLGGLALFHGMSTVTADNIKSMEGIDVAWVEEAQTLSQRSLDILRPTVRKPGSELWFSWNPRRKTDPVDAFLRGPEPPPDAVVVRANYRDNPWFPDVLRAEMQFDRKRDPDKYAHIWLGEYERHSEARVFRNWREESFETHDGADFLLGCDWGFSTDPTVLVRCYIRGRTLFVDREVYKVGCEIDATPALFDTLVEHNPGFARRWIITADSARPETISYMQHHGYPRIRGARKGMGSVNEGVEFLKSYDIVVHPRCRHTLDELALYSYKQDKLTGEVLPVLDDTKNHVIDALRYAVESSRASLQVVAAIPGSPNRDWQKAYFR